MSVHITYICKTANYQLYRLCCIRKYLTPDVPKTAMHALVSSKVDYCNSLLVGLPMTQTGRLQNIMNLIAAIRLWDTHEIASDMRTIPILPLSRSSVGDNVNASQGTRRGWPRLQQ